MHPTRAASILALIGAVLLAAALVLRMLSVVQALATPAFDDGGEELPLPVLGSYILSDDGKQLYFLQSPLASNLAATSWWSIPVDGGLPVRAEPPETNTVPFIVGWDAVFIQTGDSDRQINVSLRGEQVISAARSPDGNLLALSTRLANGSTRLYLLDREGRLSWLGEEGAYIDLDWSPDGKALAFVATRDAVDQVFRVTVDGQSYQQLTTGPERKSSPRWSPDGAWIAYLATTTRYAHSIGQATPSPVPLLVVPTRTPRPGQTAPPAPRSDVYIIPSGGGEPQPVTDTPEEEHGLLWANSARGAELLYAVRASRSPHASLLMAAGAADLSTRQVYPPLAIEGIDCPPVIAAGAAGTVRVTLRSSALAPLDLPLSLTAEGQSVLPALPASRLETVTLLPGETRVLEWQAPAAAGRFTNVTAQAKIPDSFPIAAPRCSSLNTWMGMPNLPLISVTLPGAIIGLLFCIPRLLQLRRSGRPFYNMAALLLLDTLFFAALIAAEITFGR
jgi:hypothetical protein